MNRASLVFALAMLAACAQPPAVTAPTPVATVNASFGKTWNAVIDVLADRTIPIKTIDRASGFVVAELASVPTKQLTEYTSDCGTFAAFMFRSMGSGLASYNIVVRGDSTTSTVKVTLAVTQGGTHCTTKGAFEQTVENDIKQQAEAK